MYEDDLIKSLEMSLQAQQIWDEIYPEGTSSANNLGNIGWYYHNIALQDSILQVAISKKWFPPKMSVWIELNPITSNLPR
jgi:hypothetical protein